MGIACRTAETGTDERVGAAIWLCMLMVFMVNAKLLVTFTVRSIDSLIKADSVSAGKGTTRY